MLYSMVKHTSSRFRNNNIKKIFFNMNKKYECSSSNISSSDSDSSLYSDSEWYKINLDINLDPYFFTIH